MRRRTVIAGLPVVSAGRPLAAWAQAQVRVAVLWPFTEDDAEGRALAAVVRSALHNEARTDIPHGVGGLIAASGTFSEANGDRIVARTTTARIPTVFAMRRFARRGGLMSYRPDPAEVVGRAAVYVGRILRGDNPGSLPIQAPTKADLVVNLKTARSLGFGIPPALLAQADEVVG